MHSYLRCALRAFATHGERKEITEAGTQPRFMAASELPYHRSRIPAYMQGTTRILEHIKKKKKEKLSRLQAWIIS